MLLGFNADFQGFLVVPDQQLEHSEVRRRQLCSNMLNVNNNSYATLLQIFGKTGRHPFIK